MVNGRPFVTVYAISKNEEKNVSKWCDSALEADKVVVLDTGSTDDTVRLLRERGVEVYEKTIEPWRFDAARNESLKLCPEETDIYVCFDLDEAFEPGWAEVLRNEYDPKVNLYYFTYILSEENGVPKKTYQARKIHSKNYDWIYPVHEELHYSLKNEVTKTITNDQLRLHHHQDVSKDRSQYVPLMELRNKENPDIDWRGKLHLASAYITNGWYDKAIEKTEEVLEMDRGKYDPQYEEMGCWLYLLSCYKQLGQADLALRYGYKAIAAASTARAPYIWTAGLLMDMHDFKMAAELLRFSLNKADRTWIDSAHIYDYEPYDMLCQAYWWGGGQEEGDSRSSQGIELRSGKRKAQKQPRNLP